MEIDLEELFHRTPDVNLLRIRAGVLLKWKVPSYDGHKKITKSLEIVLVDNKGCKIQATVPEGLVHLFEKKLIQNQIYVISNFSIVQNLGSYKTTNHPCRLVFQVITDIHFTGNLLKPLDGLSAIGSSDIKIHQRDHDFLVDTIGLLTSISEVKEYYTDGKIVKLILLDLTDVSGNIRCVISGKYVDTFTSILGNRRRNRHVIVLRFAKIRMFLGYPTLENVDDITTILVNPDLKLTNEFKERLARRGISTNLPVSELKPKDRIFREADFLIFYPNKTIYDLNTMIEEGFFVVSATINGYIEEEDWWYPSYTVRRVKHEGSEPEDNENSGSPVFHLSPKYNVKFNVFDGTDHAVFVLDNKDIKSLTKKSCSHLVYAAEGNNPRTYPAEIQSLLGMKLLFMVEKESASNPTLDGSYKVRKVCSNSLIIDRFDKMEVKLDVVNSQRGKHRRMT